MSIRVAVLTVSDTAAANPAADLSGPAIKDLIGSVDGFHVPENFYCIVPDNKEEIAKATREWCESDRIDWVITTGGTGFGVRDVTPEAISCLIERPAPGLVHLMLSSSLQKTPFAALSRPVAGTYKNTLITTLPGSVKAVKENLEALLKDALISHALDLIKGGSGRQLHAQIQSAQTTQGELFSGTIVHSCSHHHHHAQAPHTGRALSNDPNAPVTTRLRKSPFPIIPLETALDLIKEKVHTLEVITLPVNGKLIGHILAEDIHAAADIPSTFTTSVDGYAIRSSDPPGVYRVLTSQTHKLSNDLPPKSICRINTGGPLPRGADAVIMVEDTRLVSVFHGSATGLEEKEEEEKEEEEKEVETLAQILPFENVRRPGSDVGTGELVLNKGDKITRAGGEVATLAFVGRKEVRVYAKPVVAILSTGNEIVDLHAQSDSARPTGEGWDGIIYDTNRPSLAGALESMGYEVVDLGIAIDEMSAHINALQKGLEKADLILTTGGTSMGPTDLLKPVIERHFGGVVHFGRVAVKPGKPTTFASVPVETSGEAKSWKPLFALPGNPASALVMFYVFVVPALRLMGGWPEGSLELPKVVVQVQNPMPLDPRVEFHRVVIKSQISDDDDSGSQRFFLKAYSTGGQRSSRASSLCRANGLVMLPTLSDDRKSLRAKELATALVIGEIEME